VFPGRFKVNDGYPLAAFIGPAGMEGCDQRITSETLTHRLAQRACAFAVDDTYPGQVSAEGHIQIPVQPGKRFLHPQPTQIKFDARRGGRGHEFSAGWARYSDAGRTAAQFESFLRQAYP
jgi:hypothetical protein